MKKMWCNVLFFCYWSTIFFGKCCRLRCSSLVNALPDNNNSVKGPTCCETGDVQFEGRVGRGSYDTRCQGGGGGGGGVVLGRNFISLIVIL